MIVDANLLLFATDRSSRFHETSRTWLEDILTGPRRVGLPWASLLAVVRIVTNPRILANPLSPDDAWDLVESWLEAPSAWIPNPTASHAHVLGRLVRDHAVTGNLVPDAHLAALAIEHGVELCSADTDFARFTGLRWVNPLA